MQDTTFACVRGKKSVQTNDMKEVLTLQVTDMSAYTLRRGLLHVEKYKIYEM